MDGSVAVVGGITYNFFPFMALPLYVSLEQIDRRLSGFLKRIERAGEEHRHGAGVGHRRIHAGAVSLEQYAPLRVERGDLAGVERGQQVLDRDGAGGIHQIRLVYKSGFVQDVAAIARRWL